MTRLALSSLLLLIACILCAPPSAAQVITGTILGDVSDAAGAAVPGAQITITNTGTNVRITAAAGGAGEFTVPLLPPGVYDVEIQAAGFSTFKQTGVNLGVDQKVRVNAALAVGEVTSIITVTSEALALQTDASDLNATVSQRAIQSLPNIGRNPLRYATTVPGIVPRSTFNATGLDNIPAGENSRFNVSNFTVNGSRPVSSEILLDGAPNTSGAFNEVAVLPNLDSIGDFKVITNGYSAEFGRAGGGVLQFSTKPGTNQFHGSLYEYIRNTVLNANSFGNNSFGETTDAAGETVPVRKRGQFNINQFGGSFSGPVSFPKSYDGQDRTFFFVSYEGVRAVTDASTFLTVPTERERRGDFSQSLTTLSVGGRPTVVARNIYQPYASTTTLVGNSVRRQQFPGNVIPQNRINPVAQQIINLYPLPNITPINPDGTSNYFDSNSRRVRTDQLVLRFDQNFSERHRAFFRYSQDWTTNTPPNRFRETNPDVDTQPPTTQSNPSGTVGYTFTQSPTSLFEFRAAVTRINLVTQPATETGLNYDLTALGFSPQLAGVAPTGAFPRFEISGYPTIGILNFVLRDNRSTNSSFNGSYTKVLDKLTLKVGGEFRAYQNNFFQPFLPSLGFSNVNFTASCGGSGCPSLPAGRSEGFALADLLVGALDGRIGNGQVTTGDPRLGLTSKYVGLYTQNDWKVNRNLTLNLGLRWDYQAPLTDRYNQLTNFDIDAPQTINGRAVRGNFDFVNLGGNSRGQTDSDYNDFGPRVGLAYRPTEKTVIRAAYGISYDIVTGVGSGAQGFGTEGFSNPAFIRLRPATGQFALRDVLDQPFNNSFNGGGDAIGANPSDPRLLGRLVNAVARNQRTPYIQQWNLTVERELPGGINLEVAYVGTKGTKVVSQTLPLNGVNAIAPAILENTRAEFIRTGSNPLDNPVANPFFGAIPPSSPVRSGPSISLLDLSKPFPQYTDVTLFSQRNGSSNYHAGQVAVRRAFRNGFEVGGNYVYSKNIDFGNSISVTNGGNINGGVGSSGYNLNDAGLDRAPASNDVRHRAVIFYVADLPFGKNQPLVQDVPVLSGIVGGFKVSGITTFQSGLPLAITGGSGFGRPDLIGDPVLPENLRCFGDGVTPCALPDGSTIVVPNRRRLYFNPRAFRGRTVAVTSGASAGQIRSDIYWYGTAPRYSDRLRGTGSSNFDLTLWREFAFGEDKRLEFRAEAINVFNRTQFSDGAIDKGFGGTQTSTTAVDSLGRSTLNQSTSANFGTIDITNQLNSRYLQLSVRFFF